MTHSQSARRAQGIFANNQAAYAEHGIATFPVKEDKLPAIRGYQHVGLRGSALLAQKFPDIPALGFIAGRRSKITVLDIDTTDENVLSDALARHGTTKLIARTGSGKFHAWYSWGGESRRIRPDHSLPIDIIGGGVVIPPPSEVVKGKYEFIVGNLDDVDRLPQGAWLTDKLLRRQQSGRDVGTGLVHDGRRGDALWRFCMKNAKYCDSFDDLLDVAHTYDENSCMPPIQTDKDGDQRVFNIAKSAWGITQDGRNRFGMHGVWFPDDECSELVEQDVYTFALLGYLRDKNGPGAEFMVTNTLTDKFMRTWSHDRVAAARSRLIEMGYITQIKKAGRGHAAKFKWAYAR